jgi:hypothetical protein
VVWIEPRIYDARTAEILRIADISLPAVEAGRLFFAPLRGLARSGAGAPEILLCDLIISAFSALEAVAEVPPALLAVDVDADADDFFFDDGSRVLGSWGGVCRDWLIRG